MAEGAALRLTGVRFMPSVSNSAAVDGRLSRRTCTELVKCFSFSSLSSSPRRPKNGLCIRRSFRRCSKDAISCLMRSCQAIAEFYYRCQEFPQPDCLLESLQLDGQTKLSNYLQNILADATIPVQTDDAHFFSALEQEEQDFTLQQAFLTFRKAEAALAQRKERGMRGILKPIDTMLMELHQLKARALRSETSTASLLFGSEDIGSGHSLPEIYARIKEKHVSADAFYFDLGFERLEEAKLKDGDLVVFGGFTSHGKSILLRHMAYRQIYYYGRNVAFFSAEMSHDACRGLFALMHANNKLEYPNTPFIQYESWKTERSLMRKKIFSSTSRTMISATILLRHAVHRPAEQS